MNTNVPFGSKVSSLFLSSLEIEHPLRKPGVSTVPSLSNTREEDQNRISSLFSDYHLTVQLRVELNRRQVSLLLSILCYQIFYFGANFGMYISTLFLYEILLGRKSKASEIKDLYERQTSLLAQLILLDLGGKDLLFEERIKLSEKTSKVILQSGILIKRDTYRSRFNLYRPERLLKLRTVPVDVFIEREGNSIRYSSYCKGYGEGTGTGPVSLKRCFELDGKETEDTVLGLQLEDKDLSSELLLIAHFEWIKRFKPEN